MPTREELRSIVNYGSYDPAINERYFSNTMSSFYWSSTSVASHSSFAWGVSFGKRPDSHISKSGDYFVRAVRGGQCGSFDNLDNLVIRADGTVKDQTTGLIWQQETTDRMSWKDALLYCQNLSLGGFCDWRLPNIKELSSIANLNRRNSAIDINAFTDTMSSFYWSSTSVASNSSYARGVGFHDGDGYNYDKSKDYFVRAVRGGQCGSFDNLDIGSFKDLIIIDKLYGISGSNIYTTKDYENLENFIHLKQFDSNINAMNFNIFGLLAVGNNGQIIRIKIKDNTIDTIPVNTNKHLFDIATDGFFSIIVGKQGIIIIHIHMTENTSMLPSNTTSDIVNIQYDVESSHYYAVSSTGELLSFSYGTNWSVQKIADIPLTGIHKHENVFVITGMSGNLLVSSDGSNFKTIQIPNKYDDFLAIDYRADVKIDILIYIKML